MARQTIGEFIATQRKLKGYTQSQVAEKLGISNRTLSSWEQGRSYPDVLTLPAFAELYGVSIEEIINGERTSQNDNREVIEQEACEKPQINLLKNSLAKYRAKLAVITGLGGIGPLVLAVLFIILSYTPAFLVCAVIAELGILIILAILLFRHERLALKAGNVKRYSLAIKQSTARCVLIIGLMWFACTVLFLAYTAVLVAYDGTEFWYEFVAIPFPPAIVCIVVGTLLGEGQKEDMQPEERTTIIKNRKRTCVFSAVCAGLVLVFSVVTSIVGSIDIIKVYEGDYESKSRFIAIYQSTLLTPADKYIYNIETDNFFIDVAAAYYNTPTDSTDHGTVYHLQGELYLASDGLDWHKGSSCTLLYRLYVPEHGYTFREVAKGQPMLLNGSKLIQEYPEGGYEAIAEGKVVFFFELPHTLSMDLDENIHMINGRWAALKSVERFIEADEKGNYRYVTRAVYSRKTFENSICGELCAAAVVVCAVGCIVTRKRVDISL